MLTVDGGELTVVLVSDHRSLAQTCRNTPVSQEVALTYLGATVWVDVPHLIEARVVGVSFATEQHRIDSKGRINTKKFDSRGASEWQRLISGDTERSVGTSLVLVGTSLVLRSGSDWYLEIPNGQLVLVWC